MPLFLARLGFTLAVVCCLLGAAADGKTFQFPEHDLELQTPDDWLDSPPSAGTVAVLHDQISTKTEGDTSAGSKAVVVIVTTFPAGVHLDSGKFIAGMRKNVQEKGGVIVETGTRSVGSLLFHTTKVAETELTRPLSYMCTTFGNDRAVTLVLSSRVVDPSTDPQLDSVLRSVHFLSPYRPIPELTVGVRASGFARRHPVAVTALALVGIAAIVLLVVIIRQARAGGRRSQSSASQEP